MNHLLVLILALASVTASPLEEDLNKYDADNVQTLQKEFNLAVYVENFKKVMSEYVLSAYKHLTTVELEKVKQVLEDFLKRFADDLRKILKGEQKFEEREKIEDGMSDAIFDNLNAKVKEEFTDVSDETAKEIVYRLRKNLFATREELDQIINESKVAQVLNS
ncbi:uncharacterized protein [Battus philenor]|uniref:uncharacterized protein n=1 Tax=Battus philenor TaxID=42288 RepID=UPI0035D01009